MAFLGGNQPLPSTQLPTLTQPPHPERLNPDPLNPYTSMHTFILALNRAMCMQKS